MTVKELITELETLNPNAIIIVANDDLYYINDRNVDIEVSDWLLRRNRTKNEK